jgi:hypothetical protein
MEEFYRHIQPNLPIQAIAAFGYLLTLFILDSQSRGQAPPPAKNSKTINGVLPRGCESVKTGCSLKQKFFRFNICYSTLLLLLISKLNSYTSYPHAMSSAPLLQSAPGMSRLLSPLLRFLTGCDGAGQKVKSGLRA